MEHQYPKESEAQRIGHMAERTLSTVHPMSWRPHSLDGTDDVGFDYQVQVVDGNQYRGVFRLQLKGTESPDVNAGGEYLSIGIKLSTLKYYEGVVEPILFVACDLSEHSDPRRCPAYYVWIHDEVARVRERQLKDTQETITIRVPLANKLDVDFDVLPLLAEHRQLYESAKDLDSSLRERLPGVDAAGRSSLIGEVSQGIALRSAAFVEAITETDTFWPEAPAHTVAGQLTAANAAVSRGQRSEAEPHLQRAEAQLQDATVLEKAAFWYIKGKLAFGQSDETAACEAYARACSLAPSNAKYRITRIECDMVMRKRESRVADTADLIAEARTIDTAQGKGLAARLLVLEGKVTEARELLEKVKGSETAVDAAIVEAVGVGDYDRTVAVCTEGLAYTDLSIHSRAQLLLLLARTQLNAAVGISFEEEQVYMPAGGPSNLDVAKLESAWKCFQEAIPLLRSIGWPRVIEYASDAWLLAALYTGSESATLPDMKAAAEALPHIPDLQRALERIAAECEDFETALKANERQLMSDEVGVRRVLLLHSANKMPRCVDFALEHLTKCDKDTQQYPIALCVSITAADAVVRADDAAPLLEILNARPEWSSYRAVLSFVRARNSQILSGQEALQQFKADYEASGHDAVIGLQLLAHLDVSEETEAKYCLEVARQVTAAQALPTDLRFIVAQALATLSRWGDLLALADSTLEQYGSLTGMRSIRAVALDKLGRTTEALDELSSLIGTGERLAIDAYVKIVTRLGDVDKATKLIEQLLTDESNQHKKFKLAHLLFQLVQSSDPTSSRLPDIAWRMGQIARREVETEEGVFLLSMFAATTFAEADFEESRVEEFRRRITAFSERFPESKLFRMGTVSEESVLDDIKRMLDSFDPNAEKRQEWQRSTERQMERGELPVPYSWRPNQILGYTRDVLELWALTKGGKRDKQQLRLNMILGEWKPTTSVSRTPLIDITALLVLHDLKLFETLLKVFPMVAISQQTLRLLQTLSAAPFGSLASSTAKSIQSVLRGYRARILEPDGTLPSDSGRKLRTFGSDVQRLMETGQYALYSDDAIFAIYAAGEKGRIERLCTLDLMQIALNRNLLSLREMAENISKLCQWNVDVAISAEILCSSLPDGLAIVTSVRDGADMIQTDPVVAPILEGIWSVRKCYEDIHTHMANTVRMLASDLRNPEIGVSALVLVWYWKARLRADFDLSPESRLAVLFAHVFAAVDANEAVSRRLRSIYLRVVEGHHWHEMDEIHEHEAIRHLAVASAQFDANVSPRPEPSIGQRVAMAWTDGTADRDRFQKAYNDASIRIAQRESANEQ